LLIGVLISPHCFPGIGKRGVELLDHHGIGSPDYESRRKRGALTLTVGSESKPSSEKIDVGLRGDVVVPVMRVGPGRNQGDDDLRGLPLDFGVGLGHPSGKLSSVGRINEDDSVPREGVRGRRTRLTDYTSA
jgi:hypothetical protein